MQTPGNLAPALLAFITSGCSMYVGLGVGAKVPTTDTAEVMGGFSVEMGISFPLEHVRPSVGLGISYAGGDEHSAQYAGVLGRADLTFWRRRSHSLTVGAGAGIGRGDEEQPGDADTVEGSAADLRGGLTYFWEPGGDPEIGPLGYRHAVRFYTALDVEAITVHAGHRDRSWAVGPILRVGLEMDAKEAFDAMFEDDGVGY